MVQKNKITTFKKVIQDERDNAGVTEDVISEIGSLLDSTMSSKEMAGSEITTIADRLIKFQIKQNNSEIEET